MTNNVLLTIYGYHDVSSTLKVIDTKIDTFTGSTAQ